MAVQEKACAPVAPCEDAGAEPRAAGAGGARSRHTRHHDSPTPSCAKSLSRRPRRPGLVTRGPSPWRWRGASMACGDHTDGLRVTGRRLSLTRSCEGAARAAIVPSEPLAANDARQACCPLLPCVRPVCPRARAQAPFSFRVAPWAWKGVSRHSGLPSCGCIASSLRVALREKHAKILAVSLCQPPPEEKHIRRGLLGRPGSARRRPPTEAVRPPLAFHGRHPETDGSR